MKSLFNRILLRLIKLFNVILMAMVLVICWKLFYCMESFSLSSKFSYGWIIGIFSIIYITYGRIYESFLISLVRISEMLYSQCLALVMSDMIMYGILCLIEGEFRDVLPMVIVLFCQMIFSILWCIGSHIWYFRIYPPKKTIIIFERTQSIENLINAYGLRKKFDVKSSILVDECIANDFSMLQGIETVFLCGVHSHERNILLKHCVSEKITVYVLPCIGDVIMSSAKKMHLFHLPFLRVERYSPKPEYLIIKRLFDISMSLVAIVILSPIMIVTALAIKITDGGAVFYSQTRLTKNGREFNVLKFRSMCVDAEKDGIARLSTGEFDARITTVGRFIRKFRIDELPQLFNILEGSMSIVGPRPERPAIAKKYEIELPEFSLRLQAKAGLTGYAQVYGKYNTTPYDKLQMDLMYIAHPSFLEDLRIIFATIKILFMPESTEGIAIGMETAMLERKEERKRIEI